MCPWGSCLSLAKGAPPEMRVRPCPGPPLPVRGRCQQLPEAPPPPPGLVSTRSIWRGRRGLNAFLKATALLVSVSERAECEGGVTSFCQSEPRAPGPPGAACVGQGRRRPRPGRGGLSGPRLGWRPRFPGGLTPEPAMGSPVSGRWGPRTRFLFCECLSRFLAMFWYVLCRCC